MREVLVNAYPKSGLTWLVHLVCDLLEGVQRDNEQMSPVAWDHPVMSDWVVRKIHRPYWDDNIPYLEGKTVILIQRDPRDIIVSAMYYRGTTDLDAAIAQLVHSNYVEYMDSWLVPECQPKPGEPLKVAKLLFAAYEHLHSDPIPVLSGIIEELTGNWLTDDRIQLALDRQSFPNMVKQFGDRHFMRKGIVGDWHNHFNREQAKYFNIHFGEFMIRQGYVESMDWWKDV